MAWRVSAAQASGCHVRVAGNPSPPPCGRPGKAGACFAAHIRLIRSELDQSWIGNQIASISAAVAPASMAAVARSCSSSAKRASNMRARIRLRAMHRMISSAGRLHVRSDDGACIGCRPGARRQTPHLRRKQSEIAALKEQRTGLALSVGRGDADAVAQSLRLRELTLWEPSRSRAVSWDVMVSRGSNELAALGCGHCLFVEKGPARQEAGADAVSPAVDLGN